ncbi:peptide chain release factor N(5)-glutamine methyltransferase [Acaryochloris sp. IP29b_bin.137]|uniref:peptide chain release factor N(5)-glutamine methyltransferase n=1 Tax=Acaryochloris sp. IP29b_bin.137 TaxID=2969217 RepID=UPI00260EB907|nr:peptide chain release factor N(5)-glutamine methyltransferase [Acaryochloris sp. IP29b_bin.137]
MVLSPVQPQQRPKSNPFKVSGQRLWQWYQSAIADLSQDQLRSRVGLKQELDWLLLEVSDLNPLDLKLAPAETQWVQMQVPLEVLQQLWQQRLAENIPVQHLTETAHWRQFHLRVSKDVLIPRPETELLIDLAVNAAQHSARLEQVKLWADLGTGSGAISLGLATAFPPAMVHAVDCSQAALAVAQHNSQTYGLQDRIHFHLGQWFQPLAGLEGQFSGIVSNPPYIPTKILPTLQPEVFEHEPHLALDGGVDGLDVIREMVAIAPQYLQPGGVLLLEMMCGQAEAVKALLTSQGQYKQIQIHLDLAGIPRFAQAYRI